MPDESLSLSGLRKSFGDVQAVRDVSLEIPRGQMVGVIGRSGAGKSTLLRMINGLTEPSDGMIRFGGQRVDNLTGRRLLAWRTQCAMIFQQFNLVPRLDVLTNVMLGRVGRHATLPSLFKRFSDAERARAVHLLDGLDLLDHAFQRAETLSGGQQQRVAIARAQMQDPKILLADEPIASLDPRNATRVMDALRRINGDFGLTVLCNLHTLDTARRYSDRILGMASGRVIFDGPPRELTSEMLRDIYQVPDEEEDVQEQITAVSDQPRNLEVVRPRSAAG